MMKLHTIYIYILINTLISFSMYSIKVMIVQHLMVFMNVLAWWLVVLLKRPSA